MDEKAIRALEIARSSIKTLELLTAGDLGQDQERNHQLLRGIAGQLEWAAELLREAGEGSRIEGGNAP